MRITHNTRMNTMLVDLERKQNEIYNSQRILETGKEVEKSSDDPARAHQIMRLNDEISRRDQYSENVADAIANLGYAENEMVQLQDILQEARALAVQGAHGTYNEDDLEYLASRVDQILHEAVTIANARHEESYIFGGFNTQEAPYEMVLDATTGDIVMVQDLPSGMDGVINRIIEEGVELPVNIPGTDVFQTGDPAAEGDMFQVLIDLRDALRDGDIDSVETSIGDLDDSLDRVANTVTKIGGYINRLQNTELKLEDQNIASEEHRSEAQDADMAYWISEFQLQKITLESAMQLASKILPMSLVNFL